MFRQNHNNLRIKQCSGFTLLEVLMVILIMGLTASVVQITLPGSTTLEGSTEEQAETLTYIMDEILDRSAMEGRIIGLRVDEDGYRFEIQTKNDLKQLKNADITTRLRQTKWDTLKWIGYEADGVATEMKFSEGVTVELETGGLSIQTKDTTLDKYDFDTKSHDVDKDIPQIFFYPTGEVTPFRLIFKINGGYDRKNPIIIIGSELGTFRLFDSDKDKL